jgi:hypothetical protein
MGRPERPLNPAAGPVQAFAADLRKLRQGAGNPKYLQMQRLTGRSRTALAEAAGGDHLPTWDTVEAFVRACRGNPAEWEIRWEQVRDAVRAQRGEADRQDARLGAARAPRLFRGLPARLAGAVVVAAATAAAVIYTVTGGSLTAPHAPHRPPVADAGGPRVIVVQNKVAIGASTLLEDSTPAYLSSKPIPSCSEEHCEVPKTKMWSGAVLEATCTVHGTEMTNENTHTPGIARNKDGVVSLLWHRCMRGGRVGYLSEVYVAPAYRGGLGLPTCPA